MRTSINCSTTIAAVLHRVFVAPAQSPTLHSSVIGQHHAARNIPRFVGTTNFVARRTIVTSAAADKRETRLPRDEEIASRSVLVVQPDNSLKTEHKKQLLSTLDLTQYSLVQVIPMEPGKLPICKIIDKKALYAQKKAKAEKKAVEDILPAYVEDTPAGEKKSTSRTPNGFAASLIFNSHQIIRRSSIQSL